MSLVQVGIIGFGRIGAEHAVWLGDAQGIRAAAVFDQTPARRALAQSRGLRACATLDELLADPAIEAVLVSTPTAMHADYARKAIDAGKHVMVEKPVTLDLPQATALVTAAAKRSRVLSVFHNRRWDIDYLTARAAMHEGLFGRIINVESRLGQFASCVGPAAREWRPQWRNEASFGGGGLYDWGSHFVDQMWRLMWPSKPLRLFAQLRGNVWASDCDDFARLCIDFDNGAVGLVEINTTTARALPRWHIDGIAGSASSPASLAFDLNTWAKLEFTSADGGDVRDIPRASPGLTERQIWEQFASAIRTGCAPAVTPRSVLPTMALLDAARQSSATGKAVDLQHAVEWVY